MIRFDEVIPVAVATMRDLLGARLPISITLVRDLGGSLTVVVPDDALQPDQWNAAAVRLSDSLGGYGAASSRVLLNHRDLVDATDVLASPDRIRLTEFHPDEVWLVDRLLTNQDWLRAGDVTSPIPTAAAFSIKGGLGRSTALAVLAWHLARLGKRVIVIDLDLEAPGIGSMLLPQLPEYGAIDWFVESIVGQADSQLLEGAISRAPIESQADGSVQVIPAFGDRTHDYIAKLGRAYMPVSDDRGGLVGFSERLRSLILAVSRRLEPPDAILIDCRAGLHDIGAAAVTQIGADVFLFGRNDGPTWTSYGYLFEHLKRSKAVTWGMPDDDLRWRLKMVAAQADPTEEAARSWTSRSFLAWLPLYDESSDQPEAGHVFQESDEAAPHCPLTIVFDPGVRSMDFIDPAKRPDWSFVSAVFGHFLDGATQRLLGGANVT